MLHNKLRLREIKKFVHIQRAKEWKGWAQTLSYQILKSLFCRIRGTVIQTLRDPSILPGHLIHADRRDEVDNLDKCIRLTRTWPSSLKPAKP